MQPSNTWPTSTPAPPPHLAPPHPQPSPPRCRPTPPRAQAIDLLDEAGSRVRIAAYEAWRARGRDAAELAATSYQDLEQVMDAKDEAVRVSTS